MLLNSLPLGRIQTNSGKAATAAAAPQPTLGSNLAYNLYLTFFSCPKISFIALSFSPLGIQVEIVHDNFLLSLFGQRT